jgi:hypothetical protein
MMRLARRFINPDNRVEAYLLPAAPAETRRISGTRRTSGEPAEAPVGTASRSRIRV